MLVAILATAFAYQSGHDGSWANAFDFEALRDYARTTGFTDGLQLAAFLAFFLAFAIKVPMFPFHTWLPDAHTEAPTAGSVILAAVMLKLGAYGFIRFALPLFPDASQTFAPAIIVLSLIAIIYGAVVAMVQPDLKRLVAYSSVSHMGFVTLGIFVFTEQGLQGAILQMINHGLITGALFLLVGVIYERTHDRTIAKMGGLASRTPVYAAVFGFFTFASAGLPGLSGFVGEFLVLVGTFVVLPGAAAIATFVMILAAGYLLFMYGRIVFGELSDFLAGLGDHLTDMTPVEILTLVPLGVLVVVFGLQPGLLLDLFDTTVSTTLAEVEPATAIAIPTEVTAIVAGGHRPGRPGPHGVRGRELAPGDHRSGRRGRPLSFQDLTTISPLVAAILTACAVIVDGPHPAGQQAAGDRHGLHRPRHHGRTRAERRPDAIECVRWLVHRRCAHDLPGPPVHLDRRR